MTATLLLLLKAAVGVIIFAIGLDSTAGDATHLLHRPRLLVRSVLAMYVGVPLAAWVLVKLLTLSPGVEIGLLVLAASAGAPLLPPYRQQRQPRPLPGRLVCRHLRPPDALAHGEPGTCDLGFEPGRLGAL
jgi:hypothetical protein